MSDTKNRRKTLACSCDIFLRMFRQGRPDWEILEGVPEDARIVDVRFGTAFDTFRRDHICLLLESPSFPEVEEGKMVPGLDVTLRRVDP